MHIMDGYLPASHAAGWAAATAPFWIHSVRAVNRRMKEHPETKLLLGASGAFAFVLSALKLPSVTGSTSHPTGTGLGAVLFGPSVMTLLGTIVLIFQAFLLAHGGVTTLGANAFAMAVVGPWVAYGVYKLVRRLGGSLAVGTFFAATLGDLASYVTTSVQLSLAFPDATSGFLGAFTKFASIFAVTQIPIAVSEGLLTVVAMNFLIQYSRSELRGLGLVPKETPQ